MYINAKIQLQLFFRIENAVVAEKAAEIYLWQPWYSTEFLAAQQ